MGESRTDAGALTAGYERLRATVLSDATGGWRLGHGVLRARGMAGWLSAFGELAPSAPIAGAASEDGARSMSVNCAAPADRSVSLPDADQLVAVLAQMTLALAA